MLNFLLAYSENLAIPFTILFGISTLLFIVLTIVRSSNDIDRDDWLIVMRLLVPILIFSCFMISLPSVEHIKEVQSKYETKPEEKVNESKCDYCPSRVH